MYIKIDESGYSVQKQCNLREILDKSFLLYSNKHVRNQREFQFHNNTIVTLHESVKARSRSS